MTQENIIEEKNERFNPLFKSLLHPRETIRYITENETNSMYYIMFYGYGLINFMDGISRNDYHLSYAMIISMLIFAPVLAYFDVYITGWLYSLFGRLLGGKATPNELRMSVLWSVAPLVLFLPFSLATFVGASENFVYYIISNITYRRILYLTLFVEIILAVWSYINSIRMVSEVQGFSKWRAFLSMILPGIIMIAAIVIIISFFALTI